jgi:hypothetical protein
MRYSIALLEVQHLTSRMYYDVIQEHELIEVTYNGKINNAGNPCVLGFVAVQGH